jgi:hypothetical protein
MENKIIQGLMESEELMPDYKFGSLIHIAGLIGNLEFKSCKQELESCIVVDKKGLS